MSSLAGRRIVVANWRDTGHELSGGAEVYADQFARALVAAGAVVTFLTSREPGEPARSDRDGYTVRRGGGQLGFYPFALGWLLRHRRRIDLIVDPAGGLPTFSPLVLRRSTPAVLIVHHVHQDQFAAHYPAPVAAFGRWLERVAMRATYRGHATVAVSESTREQMRRRLDWTGPISVLENGTTLPEAGAQIAAKDPDRIVVLGRLVRHKRVDAALVAFAEARRHPDLVGRDLRLDVVGRGPVGAELAALAEQLGLSDVVTFHGYATEQVKNDILDAASLQICASDAEGWGQVVIDAAAHGVPTLARDVPGLRDSIRDRETGWLVPDTDVAAFPDGDRDVIAAALLPTLVRAMRSTLDPEMRLRRAEACTAWAHKFDWSQMHAAARTLTERILTDDASVSPVTNPPRTRVAD